MEYDFEKIMDKLLEEAEGNYDFLRSIKMQIDFFTYGLNRQLPPEWLYVAKEVANNVDPEYETYLRLKNKFERIQ